VRRGSARRGGEVVGIAICLAGGILGPDTHVIEEDLDQIWKASKHAVRDEKLRAVLQLQALALTNEFACLAYKCVKNWSKTDLV
jgi:hypothetical protein